MTNGTGLSGSPHPGESGGGRGGTPALGSMGSESSWGPETRMTCGEARLRIDLLLTAQTQASGRTAARTPAIGLAPAESTVGGLRIRRGDRARKLNAPMDTSGRVSTRWT